MNQNAYERPDDLAAITQAELNEEYDAELRRREQAQPCPYCDGFGTVTVGMNPASVDGMEECVCQRDPAQHTPGPTQDELIRSNRELYDLLNAAHSRWDEVYAESQRRGARIIELERDKEAAK